MAQNPKLAHFEHIWAHTTNIVYKIPHKIKIKYPIFQFWNPHIAVIILSYRTLKSNNFEKLTYNANWTFWRGGGGGVQNYFFGPNFFWRFFYTIGHGKTLLHPEICKTSLIWYTLLYRCLICTQDLLDRDSISLYSWFITENIWSQFPSI